MKFPQSLVFFFLLRIKTSGVIPIVSGTGEVEGGGWLGLRSSGPVALDCGCPIHYEGRRSLFTSCWEVEKQVGPGLLTPPLPSKSSD